MSIQAVRALSPEKAKLACSIIVMEDNEQMRGQIISTLEKLRCPVHVISGGAEAVELAEQGIGLFYILDINMGRGRSQEGLDTLERLKKIKKEIFVGIYSGLERKRFEPQAYNLGADIFVEKSASQINDLCHIMALMFSHFTKDCYSECESLAPSSSDHDGDDSEPPKNNNSLSLDVNVAAFQEFISDPKKFRESFGQYVAFVDGRFFGKDLNRQELLAQVRQKYPNRPRFFAKVEGRRRIIELPTPFLR